MKNKINVALVSVTLLIGTIAAKGEIVTRTRTAVDTVKAMSDIQNKFQLKNEPHVFKIQALDRNITDLDTRIKENKDSVTQLVDLRCDLSPKVKEKEKVNKIFSFLSSSIDKMPADSIYAYCKDKDLQKARAKEQSESALNELRIRTKEKILKKAAKGDFSSGFANGCISYFNEKSMAEADRLSAERQHAVMEREKEKSMLSEIPTVFTADLWLTNMDSKEVPTKEITECRERRGADDLTYSELVNKYYNTPDLKERFFNNLTAQGKFNKVITDKVTVFPAIENNNKFDWEWKSSNKIQIVSEKGTVPPLVIDIDYINNTNGNTYYGDYEFNSCDIEAVSDFWNTNGIKKIDGIVVNFLQDIFFFPETFVVVDDKWVKTSPLNPYYLSFEECKNLLISKTKDSSYKFKTSLSEDVITLLPVTRESLGVPKNLIDDGLTVIKSDLIDLRYDNIDLNSIKIESNKWGYGDDGLTVYYLDRKDKKYKVEKYALMYGVEGAEWVLREEGTYNPETGKEEVHICDFDTGAYTL